MTVISDVLVVGAGAIGASCARALAVAGARVTMVGRPGDAGEGWRASAGMLAAQLHGADEDPLLELALAGRAFFAEQAAALEEATGIGIDLTDTGILQLAGGIDEVAALKERVAWQRQHALRADWLDGDDLAERWPWLGRCLGAFWSPEDGAVDPVRLVAAMTADATRRGTRLVADTIIAVDHDGTRLHGVIGEQGRYACETVVIAAGAWSGRLKGLPRPLSVEPVRGQMLAFDWPAEARPVIVYGSGCYLLRRGPELLVGATMEQAGYDAIVTPAGLADLTARAAGVYPPLAAMRPVRSWAGLRPATPDGRPIIGAEPRLAGLWYATGHGRNGILLSGITGQLIARGIGGEPATGILDACRPTRFWEW